MASRPTLVAETPAALPSRRKQAVDKAVDGKAAPVGSPSRTVTIHCDVAATVRWSLIGLAAVLVAIAFLVVAWRGGSNYPSTSSIQAIGTVIHGPTATPAGSRSR